MGAEATENLLKGRISYRSQRQLSSTPTEKYLLISENVLEKRNPILLTIEAHAVVMWNTKSNWEKRKNCNFFCEYVRVLGQHSRIYYPAVGWYA